MTDCFAIFGRNLLVLALHSMACVAGFMAGASMPQIAAAQTSRVSRLVHEHAGRFAILFVIAATIFSLGTQAYVLGYVTSANYGYSVRRSIAYGYLPAAYAEAGTKVLIQFFGERSPATVAREPLHRPERSRSRG